MNKSKDVDRSLTSLNWFYGYGKDHEIDKIDDFYYKYDKEDKWMYEDADRQDFYMSDDAYDEFRDEKDNRFIVLCVDKENKTFTVIDIIRDVYDKHSDSIRKGTYGPTKKYINNNTEIVILEEVYESTFETDKTLSMWAKSFKNLNKNSKFGNSYRLKWFSADDLYIPLRLRKRYKGIRSIVNESFKGKF